MTGHATFDQIGDYADGALDLEARTALEAHLAGCVDCRALLSRVESLRASAAALPRAVEPPVDLWAGVRERIERQRVRTIGPRSGRGEAWRRRARLAAAAVLLVAASSAITAVIVRRAPERIVVVEPSGGAEPARALAAFRDVEADYTRVAGELERSLDAQRSTLSPAAIASIEESLRVIDEAIREARAALERDPGDQRLVDILSTTYEQKLDLLKRTATFAART